MTVRYFQAAIDLSVFLMVLVLLAGFLAIVQTPTISHHEDMRCFRSAERVLPADCYCSEVGQPP
jgi:hypothetical protein